MTDKNRIDLIGRYMSGAMRPDELAEFQHRLKSDASLQRMMEAEDLIRTTIRRDVEAIPTNHPATRMRVMDLLADAGRHAPGASGGAAGSGGASGGASAGTGLTWFTKAFLGSMIGLGLATGGYLVVKNNRAQQAPPPAASAPAETQAKAPAPPEFTRESEPGTSHDTIPSSGAPAAAEESRSPASLQETPRNVPLQPQERAGSRRAPSSTAPVSAEPDGQAQKKATVPSNAGTVTPPSTPSSTPPSQPKASQPRKVISNDQVNVDIQVQEGKPKQ